MSTAVIRHLEVMKSTLYLRTHGCVCYEGDFLAVRKVLDELPDRLLSLDAAWLWASSRIRPLPQGSTSSLPASRTLTQLLMGNAHDFVADFLERDVDGYGRSAMLLGIDAGFLPGSRDQNDLESALRDFALNASGPIYLILLQPGDAAEFVFVSAVPSNVAAKALQSLGVSQATPETTRQYRELRGLQLENVINRIVAIAFGDVSPNSEHSKSQKP